MTMKIEFRTSSAEKYPARQHAQRVAAALGCERGLIFLTSQTVADKEDSDMPKTWYQRRFFYYLSGVDEPDNCLIYDCRTHQLTLYVPDINWDTLIWTGRGSTVDEARQRYDVDNVQWRSRLFADVQRWLRKRSADELLYVLHHSQAPAGFDDLPLESNKLLHTMDLCRAVKDPHEIRLIERANEISTAAHLAVLRTASTAQNEAELSAIFQRECIARFAVQAYDPIVAAGSNASTLHYTANNAPLQGRQLMVLDAGAAHRLYASDVTRTFPLNGKWTREAREIYDLVLDIQTAAIAAAQVGARMLDLHNEVIRRGIRGFLELGILHRGSVEEIEAAGTQLGFYPHGLGHHVGLETHDCQSVPLLKYPRKAPEEKGEDGEGKDESSSSRARASHAGFFRQGAASAGRISDPSEDPVLQPGNVITIEPGLYFNRDHLERNYLHHPAHARYINAKVLEKYWDVGGVRIEDDILILRHGNRNLTTAPKDPDEMCRIIRGQDK